MAERYNVRNVAQKEVYDSYMGILRISPIEVNGKDMDDITSILNTLVDFDGNVDKDGIKEKNSIIKVRLSDSDGNGLPITFIPKAFNQQVLIRESGADTYQTRAIINMVTNVDRFIFVSENLSCRSTISIKLDTTKDADRASLLQIATGGGDNNTNVSAKTILCYPIEAPNDEDYFNNKNKLGVQTGTTSNGYLFDPIISNKPRHEQVKQNLLKQSRSWYEQNFPINDNDNTSPHRVKVAGRFINRYNEKGQEVPVLHTRDYVLGHYDGHSWSKSSKEADDFQQIWCGNTSKLNQINDFSHITKLSWMRFDDLVWDALDEVLQGNVRHTKGRYSNLGSSKTGNSDIRETLFGDTSDEEFKYSKLDRTAPILGAGVEQGIIMYHAMPFHRYWFHRCRQATQNLKRKAQLLGDVDWNYGTTEGSKQNNEAYRLQKACKIDNSITPCSMATLSPTHSLSKDYLLCNGLDVSFENFPNISPTNENLFMTKNGKPVTVDKDTKKYKFRSNHSPQSNSFDEKYTRDNYNKHNVYNALQQTSIESFVKQDGKTRNYQDKDRIYLPNLFSLTEQAPRFIRGLDWDADDSCVGDITKYSSISTKSYEEDGGEIKKIYYPSKKWLEEDTLANPVVDIFGQIGFAFQRNFDKVKLHFYNYDHLVETKRHYHYLFSSHQGGQGDKEDLSYCYYYDYDANNGGDTHKKWTTKNTINRNFLFNNVSYNEKWLDPKIDGWNVNKWVVQKSEEWLRYCFYKNSIQSFFNFTPIPNCGLFLFNGDLYNNPSSDDYNLIIKITKDCIVDEDGKALSEEEITNKYGDKFPLIQTFSKADQELGGKVIYNILKNKYNKKILDKLQNKINYSRDLLDAKFSYTVSYGIIHFTVQWSIWGMIWENFSWNTFKSFKKYDDITSYVMAFSPYWAPETQEKIKNDAVLSKKFEDLFTSEKAQSLMNGDNKIYLGSIEKYENDNWNNFTYHDGKNNTHDFSAANIGLKKPPSISIWSNLSNEEKYDFLQEHAEQKLRRKMLMMKINESEARIPISYIGKAQFSTSYYFTYERKRSWWSSTFGGDDWDTETEHFKMTNVGNYEMSTYKPHPEVTPKWRCLSSLGYTDPQYLAYGNIADDEDPQIRDTYWNTHNVTDFFKQDVAKKSTTTYGDKKITLDIQSPYPSHIKLLPLIRL